MVNSDERAEADRKAEDGYARKRDLERATVGGPSDPGDAADRRGHWLRGSGFRRLGRRLTACVAWAARAALEHHHHAIRRVTTLGGSEALQLFGERAHV